MPIAWACPTPRWSDGILAPTASARTNRSSSTSSSARTPSRNASTCSSKTKPNSAPACWRTPTSRTNSTPPWSGLCWRSRRVGDNAISAAESIPRILTNAPTSSATHPEKRLSRIHPLIGSCPCGETKAAFHSPRQNERNRHFSFIWPPKMKGFFPTCLPKERNPSKPFIFDHASRTHRPLRSRLHHRRVGEGLCSPAAPA